MNSYNIFDENHPETILYHAVAESEDHVKELAEESGIDLSELVIEIERTNVKDQLGRPFKPYIEDALVY